MSVENSAHTSEVIRFRSLQAWAIAIRPKTLLVAISPVLVGATLGFQRGGVIDVVAAMLVLGAALLMQVVTNMQNDVGYTVRGGEAKAGRTGLPRATSNGWLGVRDVRLAIVVAAIVATALGVALVAYRGWPVLAIGVASLLAALAYMGGPKPIAYTPFGELTVFAFFGLVAVIGTDWVLTGNVGAATVLASVAIGALAAAALAVNNHRDIAHDRLVGRRTFAVTFGDAGSRHLFSALVALPFVLLPAMAWFTGSPALMLPVLLTPMALDLRHRFLRCPPGTAFNDVLFRTFRLELWFAALLSAGAVLARWVG